MPQQKPVERRDGPRPLPLHLLAQASILFSSPAGLTSSSSVSPAWKPHLAERAAELRRDLAVVDPEAWRRAVNAEARRRADAFLRGVQAYRRHPYRRELPEPPVVWRDGTTRLLDYGRDHAAPAVLVVPSLINRYYILDLTPRRSLVRYLADKGLRPLVVDWGAPGEVETGFTLDDYIAGRLEAMLELAAGHSRAAVLGYCMGGLLALALAARRPERIGRLALLATPWDFHAEDASGAAVLAAMEPAMAALMEASGALPVDALQTMFAAIDPMLVPRKFGDFATLKSGSRRARDFVAVEDWVNDGVPLATPVARASLFGWYAANAPARGEWRVAGVPIRPQHVAVPALVMVPSHDRIVPPRSALALAEALPLARTRCIASGHIGMITGRLAKSKVYAPLAKWLSVAAMQHSTCV